MSGQKDGWSRLAKNLKTEIDEELIEAYRGTVSLPFETGDNRRLAVRVRPKINLHFQVLRRPHGKAREGRIAGLFNRRATQPCGMDRRMKM
jgi:hypothetical protein